MEMGDRRISADDVFGHLERVGQGRCRFEPHPPDRCAIAADDDHATEVLEGVGAPVPHVEGMHAVVGV